MRYSCGLAVRRYELSPTSVTYMYSPSEYIIAGSTSREAA